MKNDQTIRLPAPAKLNLFLHVLNRRADNYHNLQTVFQFLTYSDELIFTLRKDKKINFLSSFTNLPWKENLIFKAAQLLQQKSETFFGVDVGLIKKIPLGAGLGGGSSNAATTLWALNHLWQLGYSSKQLAEFGLELGADVPVFVNGYSAWAEGVGEKLTPIDLPEVWYLVVVPPCHVETKKIFSHSQLTRNSPAITIGDFKRHGGRNDLQTLVCQLYPVVGQALVWLSQFAKAQMTGSGGSVFAAFATEQEAQTVRAQLPNLFTGFVSQGINVSPLHECFSNWGVAKR